MFSVFSYRGYDILTFVSALGLTLLVAIVSRSIYNLYFHPLAKYPGPWYTSSFSVCLAIISVLQKEPQWLMSLVKKYGSTSRLILIEFCIVIANQS